MGQFVTDIAALGAFGTAAYKIILGWYRFRASRTKRGIQLGPFDALSQALKAAAVKGGRDTPEWGRGAVASGHAHVVAQWNVLPTASKIALVEDMLQIAVLTGQLSDIKAVREGRLKWSQLSQTEQVDILAALDGLTLDSLGQTLKESAPELAESWLWQVTEVPPLLAEEPVLSEPCSAELTLLTKAFDKADKAVKEVLNTERTRHLESLTQAMGPLNAATATANLKELKLLISDGLSAHLGPEALTVLSKELRSALEALVQSEDGGLLAAAEAKEAAKKLDAQVDAKAVEDRLGKEHAAHAAARATEVAHVVQVASAPSQWSPSAPLALKVALVELLLGEVAAAKEGDAGLDKLVDAAQKAVAKLPLPDTEGLSERVQALSAALSASSTTAPIANGTSEPEGEEDTPPAPTVKGEAAARELLVLLVEALKEKLPAEPEALSGDEGIVSTLVRGVLSRVIASATPGGVMAAAGAGVAALQRVDVVAAVKAEAARKADAQRQPALSQIESDAASVRSLLASKVLTSQVADAESNGDGVTTGQRLALAAAFIKNVVLPGPGASLASGTQRALGLLRPETDAQPLTSGATATVAHAQQLAIQLALATDLSSGLDLGNGLVALLDRLDAFCATAKTGEVIPAVANGHANGAGEEHDEEDVQSVEVVEVIEAVKASEEEAAHKPLTKEQVSKVQELVAALLADGLVLLELSGIESRKLSLFKAAVDGCSASASTDQVVFNRHLTSLKDMASQLGPILGALEVKCASTSGARQQVLLALKSSAVSSYKALQELLALEGNVRTSSVDSLSEIRDIVYGLKLQRGSALLESGLARLDGVKAKAEGVVGWVAALQGSEDAVSEVMVMEEQVDRVTATVRVWADWVRLRETALAITPADATTSEEDADIELPPLQELQDMHEGEATFIDMYAMPGAEEGSDEGEKREVAASTYAQQGDEEAAEQRQMEYHERLEGWQKQGEKLIARGQVAIILMVGDVTGSDLKCTRDIGLPSTKSALQLFAERLLKVQQLAAAAVMGEGAGIVRPVDWYIVAPQESINLIKAFLSGAGCFGLQSNQVHLVPIQVTRPALGPDLKVIMDGPGRMAKSPACSGDVWAYLDAAGQLKALRKRGARVVEVHTIEDNLLARPADPLFVGCFFQQQLDAAAKAGDPAGLMHVYEGYAAMLATSKAAQSFSRYVSGLGTYAFSAEFIKGVEGVLRDQPLALYRLSPAASKVAAGAKAAATPAGSNTVAYRMDRHLSDWVTSSGIENARAGVVFVGVSEEFAPAVGVPPLYIPPSPTAATDQLLLLNTSWVEAAGGAVEDPEEGVVEVSPLVSYGGEGLEGLVEGKVFTEAYDLDLQGYAPAPGKRLVLPHAAITVPLAVAWIALAAVKAVAKQ